MASDPSQKVFLFEWNHQKDIFRSTFAEYLKDQRFTDVILFCEGNTIKCHKLVLAASSLYFEEEITKDNVRNKILVIQGMTFAELQKVVEFLYNGKVVMEPDQLEGFLKAAEKLKVKGLIVPDDQGQILNLVVRKKASGSTFSPLQP